MADQENNKQTGAGHIDLSKVILPKKEGAPSVDSAQRINAGILFEQEQHAALPVPPKPEAPPAPTPKPDQPLVKPLQTYQSDIESVVGEKHVSVVTIASAEADRRAAKPLPQNTNVGRPWLKKTLSVAAGIALLVVASGTGLYIYSALQPVPVERQFPSPFISVDETVSVTINPKSTRGTIMKSLVEAHNNISLSLGLVARIQVTKETAVGDGSLAEVGAPELLQILAPRIPLELVRTLAPQMLLGMHSFDENQPFLILQADSYETAYSGMLSWEATMQLDLSPLFTKVVAVRPSNAVPTGPASASTSLTTASTTVTTVSDTPTPESVRFFEGNFSDKIVENRDARVVLNDNGEILLLWTFLDRSTIVITTNNTSLREIVSRLSRASTVTLPGSR